MVIELVLLINKLGWFVFIPMNPPARAYETTRLARDYSRTPLLADKRGHMSPRSV